MCFSCFLSFFCLPIIQDEIFGTAYTAALYLKYKLNFSGKVYLMGAKGMEEEMELHGIEYTGTGVSEIKNKSIERSVDACQIPLHITKN